MLAICLKCSKPVARQRLQCPECLEFFHPACFKNYITYKTSKLCCIKNAANMMSGLEQQLVGLGTQSISITLPGSQSSYLHKSVSPSEVVESAGASRSTSPTYSQSVVSLEAIMELLKKKNDSLDSFMERQNRSNEELNAKLDFIKRIKLVVEEHSARIANLEADNEENKLTIARLETENAKLADDIIKLRSNTTNAPVPNSAEIVISGIPTSAMDNPQMIVSKVLDVLDVLHLANNVLEIRQIARKAPQKPNHVVSSQQRQDDTTLHDPSKLLIVRFKSSQISNFIINKKRSKGPITIEEILSTQQHGFVYVNEFLHPNTYNLLRKTKERAMRVGWKFVWTHDGQVCARRHDGTSIV